MDAADRHANPSTHLRRTVTGAAVASLVALSSCTATSSPSTSSSRAPAAPSSRPTASGTPTCRACRSTRARPPTSTASGGRPGSRPTSAPGTWDGGPIGIPYTVVAGAPARGAGRLRLRRRERPRPVPHPADAPIEGGPDSDGDRHVLVVDRDACRLYELYDAHPERRRLVERRLGRGLRPAIERPAARRLDLRRRRRPADPPRARPLRRGRRRARSTTPSGSPCPTTQQRLPVAGPPPGRSSTDPDLPPMGLRLRLKAGVDISGFAAEARVILAGAEDLRR